MISASIALSVSLLVQVMDNGSSGDNPRRYIKGGGVRDHPPCGQQIPNVVQPGDRIQWYGERANGCVVYDVVDPERHCCRTIYEVCPDDHSRWQPLPEPPE